MPSRPDGPLGSGRRDRIEALIRAASGEPWAASAETDADLLSDACVSVPAIVAELRRLREESATARALLERWLHPDGDYRGEIDDTRRFLEGK